MGIFGADHVVGHRHRRDEFAGRVVDFHVPHMDFLSFLHEVGQGGDGVAFEHRLHMAAADADAHADFPGAQGRGKAAGCARLPSWSPCTSRRRVLR